MQETFTFDDVLLQPQYSAILPKDTDLSSRLTPKIKLRLPFMSAPMDTVTEHRMAIAMALAGGIGIIHKNLSFAEQVREVELVKRFENGFIVDPLSVSPEDKIEAVYEIRKEKGYGSVPVVDSKGILVGLITKFDYFWPHDQSRTVREMMVSAKDLVIAPATATLSEANDIIYKKRLGVLCVVEKSGRLSAIVTRKDLEKNEMYPQANKDVHKRLRVGAALGVGGDIISQAKGLASAGADVLVIDKAHGHSLAVIEAIKKIKKEKSLKDIDVIAGNVASAEGVKDLIAAGADAVKIGVGPGSICTTRVIAGIGVPQLSAIMAGVKGRGKSQACLIADGGIKYSGDIVKALAAGADAVMIGNLFAGAEESPGEIEYFNGRMYKAYRGMGSIGAMSRGSKDRYGQSSVSDITQLIPEGIEGRSLYRGPASTIIHQLAGGLRSGMSYNGAKTIQALQKKAKFVRITNASLKESHPHDVEITKQSPNYS